MRYTASAEPASHARPMRELVPAFFVGLIFAGALVQGMVHGARKSGQAVPWPRVLIFALFAFCLAGATYAFFGAVRAPGR